MNIAKRLGANILQMVLKSTPVYEVVAECRNCKKYLIGDAPKGMLIKNMKCPNCGKKRLERTYRREVTT